MSSVAQNRLRNVPAVILSPTTLSQQVREHYRSRYGDQAVFWELVSLRREGIGQLFKKLRSKQAEVLIVTGSKTDLRLLKDYLVGLAFLAPAKARYLVQESGESRPLRAFDLPTAGLRILGGAFAGFWALFRNWWRVRRLALIPDFQAVESPLRRCLYLKPVLMFGMPVGGSTAHVAGVVNGFNRLGTKVRILSSTQQQLLDSDVSVKRVPPSSLIAFPHELNQHRYQSRFLREAYREQAAFQADFIYQRYCLNDLTGVRLRKRLGIPLILEFNGSEVWVQKHWGRALRFHRTSEKIELENLKKADLIVVVSEAVKRQVLEAGIPEDRVLFYPNCVDAQLFDPNRFEAASIQEIRQRLAVPGEAQLFTFVGTFGHWHGTEILAQAMRCLIDGDEAWLQRQKVHFLLVGDGPKSPNVREILGPGLGKPFVTLAGLWPQHEIPGILAASDFMLSPHIPNPDGSAFFGSPTKLFEYMAMEKPIVASELDQIGHILRGWTPTDGDNPAGQGEGLAILVEPGNLDHLIAAIRKAADLPIESRKALGRRARAHVLRAFTWDKNVESVMRALKEISARRSRGAETEHSHNPAFDKP